MGNNKYLISYVYIEKTENGGYGNIVVENIPKNITEEVILNIIDIIKGQGVARYNTEIKNVVIINMQLLNE